MSMEYTVFDSRTFCTGQERAMQLLYGEVPEAEGPTGAALHLQTAASRVLSLLVSLKVSAVRGSSRFTRLLIGSPLNFAICLIGSPVTW